VKRSLIWIGKVSLFLFVGVAGGMVGRFYNPANIVHAQSTAEVQSNCIVAIPKAWGEFKGGSEFGLAFEDQSGTLRFLLHLPCGSMNTPIDYNVIDLKVIRK
jgi:hypothetical protein